MVNTWYNIILCLLKGLQNKVLYIWSRLEGDDLDKHPLLICNTTPIPLIKPLDVREVNPATLLMCSIFISLIMISI